MAGNVVMISPTDRFRHYCEALIKETLRPSIMTDHDLSFSASADDVMADVQIHHLRGGYMGGVCRNCGTEFRVKWR